MTAGQRGVGDMRRLSREEAARERGVTLRTLDRWIAEGSVNVERIKFGRQTRVLVLMDDERVGAEYDVSFGLLGDGEILDVGVSEVEEMQPRGEEGAGDKEGRVLGEPVEGVSVREVELEVELAKARERVRGLEDLVGVLKDQNTLERSRYGELYQALVNGTLALPEAERHERPWWKFWERSV